MAANTNSDYPWVRAWGRMLGSKNWYIEDQVARARQAKAPANAIYERYDSEGPTGNWATTDDITSASTRRVLGMEDK